MRVSRTNLSSLAFVLLSFAIAAASYSRLPESVPTHWNARGEADGFAPKPWGPFVLPLAAAGVYLLFVAIPRISPRGYRVDRFQQALERIQLTVIAFLLLVTTLVLLTGIGAPVPMDRALHAGLGILFIVLGNFMGKLTKNFFIGIRTPWTLASDEVWFRTHRLAGKLFVMAGLVSLVSGLLGGGVTPLLSAALLAGGIPVLYSYFLYRRIEGFGNRSQGGH